MAAPSFLECVGAVARKYREDAHAQLIDIAFWSRASQGTVSRFETGESQPRDLDGLLTAYAKVSNIPAVELLKEAMTRWEEGGGAVTPELTPFPREPGPAEDLAESLEEAAGIDERRRDKTAQERPAPRRRRGSR